jgi:hypothetical protein
MKLELIKTVAALCQIMGGDTNAFNSVVGQIHYQQQECQAFYARCLSDGNSLELCMQEIKLKEDNDRENLEHKFNGDNQMGPWK